VWDHHTKSFLRRHHQLCIILLVIEQLRHHRQLVATCHIPTPVVSCCSFNEALRDQNLSHYYCSVIAILLRQLIVIAASSPTYFVALLPQSTPVGYCCLFIKSSERTKSVSFILRRNHQLVFLLRRYRRLSSCRSAIATFSYLLFWRDRHSFTLSGACDFIVVLHGTICCSLRHSLLLSLLCVSYFWCGLSPNNVGRCYSQVRLFIIVLLFGIHSINLGISYIQ
jgi:hypothetical protein